ncbi:hypothetical protein MNBD_GAMMA22-751 [hydrothermal vent metagenome]|uniref:Polyketide cyclase/dehydrase n=1 Tax=hydrothermal vent metagenome TaxID=652676 RepID=A0A3B0ZPB6_9ZZZZ
MHYLKFSAIFVAILVLIAGIVGFFLPKDYSITRSITINASNDTIHNLVGDLDNWDQWTTWKLDDPSIVIFKGALSQGVGASQSWKGDSGEGKLEFTVSSVEKGITYDLYFDGGDQKSIASISYADQGATTVVTWKMTGNMEIPILGGYFSMLVGGMIETMFDRGLVRLKNIAEKKR